MQTVRFLHDNFSWFVIAANLAVGIWGLVLWRTRGDAPKPYWISLAVAWGSIYVQGLLGIAMFERHQPPFRHHFYGFLFVLITVFVFTMRGEKPSRRIFAFGASTLFIGIVAIRATFSL